MVKEKVPRTFFVSGLVPRTFFESMLVPRTFFESGLVPRTKQLLEAQLKLVLKKS